MAKTKRASRWHEPTTFSKFLAVMLFILLPFFFFWFGMTYQKTIDAVKYEGALYQVPEDLLEMPAEETSSPSF